MELPKPVTTKTTMHAIKTSKLNTPPINATSKIEITAKKAFPGLIISKNGFMIIT